MKEPITGSGIRSTFEIVGDMAPGRNDTGYVIFEAIGTREQIEKLAQDAFRHGIVGAI